MNVLLFDIDGTLLLTGGAGRVAMQRTMRAMFDLSELALIDVHGRTDHAIISDLFSAHQIELTSETRAEFVKSYHQELAYTISQCDGYLMPGVVELLVELHLLPNVTIGILTGNSQRAAQIKLQFFKIERFFVLGGYGDDHTDRNRVARTALERCEDHFGASIDGDRIWVIGDTVHDIRCARSIGAKAIAVETGGGCPEKLQDEEPDLLLPDLTHQKSFLNALN